MLRLIKPFLNSQKFTRSMNALQKEVMRAEAKDTLKLNAKDLFKPAKHSPALRPIDILIPVYNGYEYLAPCLQSILQGTDLPFHLYLADDCSTDSRVWPFLTRWAQEHPAKVTLLKNTVNSGFAKTVNKLIAASYHDFVLLNTDTEVPPAWASRLFYPLFTDEQIASCGPWTNSGGIQNFFFGHEDTPLDVPLRTMDNAVKNISPDIKIHFPGMMGFCMAIKRKAVRQIGALDEIYGRGYYEETDWGLRALTAGWKHQLVPNLFVYHKGRSSFSTAEFDALMAQNKQIFIKRYPFADRAFRKARKNTAFKLLSFIIIGKYLSIKFPGFIQKGSALPQQPALLRRNHCYTLQWQNHTVYAYQKEDPAPFLQIN